MNLAHFKLEGGNTTWAEVDSRQSPGGKLGPAAAERMLRKIATPGQLASAGIVINGGVHVHGVKNADDLIDQLQKVAARPARQAEGLTDEGEARSDRSVDVPRLFRLQRMVSEAAQVEATHGAAAALVRSYRRLRDEILLLTQSVGLEELRQECERLFPYPGDPPRFNPAIERESRFRLQEAASEDQMNLRLPSGPGTEGRMPYFRYRLFWHDGGETGSAMWSVVRFVASSF